MWSLRPSGQGTFPPFGNVGHGWFPLGEFPLAKKKYLAQSHSPYLGASGWERRANRKTWLLASMWGNSGGESSSRAPQEINTASFAADLWFTLSLCQFSSPPSLTGVDSEGTSQYTVLPVAELNCFQGDVAIYSITKDFYEFFFFHIPSNILCHRVKIFSL